MMEGGSADFRTTVELYLASAMLLVADQTTPGIPIIGVATTTALTGLVRVFEF